jgi:hypothetical protein
MSKDGEFLQMAVQNFKDEQRVQGTCSLVTSPTLKERQS